MEERPPIRRVAANILNKQSRTADKGWSSSLRVLRGANNSSPLKRILLRIVHTESRYLVGHKQRKMSEEVGYRGIDWIELAQDTDR
jgi:hypothetical protein